MTEHRDSGSPAASRAGVLALLAAVAMTAPLAAQSGAPGMLVTGEWLAAHLRDPGLVILHADGNRQAYDAGHIPGARFLAQDQFSVPGDPEVALELPPVAQLVDVLAAAGVNDDSRIVVYSQSVLAGTRLWLTLDYLGLGERASLLDGGLARWKAESRPVTKDVPAVERGRLTAHPRQDMIVTAEWIHARLDDPKMLLLDARPDDEYTGADNGMGGMAHPGHIPGAYQLYFEELIRSRQDPAFLPTAELRRKFAEAGADQASTVVTYCMIGARASLNYFVGRMLGYEMKFYDGSWHDWGTRDLPYVKGTSRR